ncbi:MAG: translation initiation factor IF-1 [Candidatus Moeniiplasma glomeromycotorum]|nr:translation initiation factor IF-1 [Candidatus Moeniiplasma glomeromycotorum]MCE8162595.1 translation initiation factor IF-1 [Candidatus Moeniiplasma glomeromycotorum]MCE8164093.1 translation initiation factor IF-1 [Candidatus Moeniiplasma glomeromycotorum]MCE8166066.1 translation initiation factor IF-1 [Candidatus Moeniiplasma glomeromycotorum]MCE8166676.1 translation initiation factor IF-1 [Candidatus Moeniiplasma glomeromycotorum]
MKNNEDFLQEPAEIIKKLPNNQYQVKFDNGRIIKVKTAKRLKKIVVGDRVMVKLPLRDLTNGQIVGLILPT